MLLSGSKRTLEKLVAAGPNVTLAIIEYTFLAAGITRTPAQVFDQFFTGIRQSSDRKTKAAEEAQVLSRLPLEKCSAMLSNGTSIGHTRRRRSKTMMMNSIGNATYLWEIGRKGGTRSPLAG